MESPMGTVSHVPLYGVKCVRTSPCPVALNPECVKVQLNEPGYRFQISGLDIITPIISYGNVQGATVFVDALQRSLDRKRRRGILFSARCSNVSKPQTEERPGTHDFGIRSLRANASQHLCLQSVASVRVNAEKGEREATHFQKHQTQRTSPPLCSAAV